MSRRDRTCRPSRKTAVKQEFIRSRACGEGPGLEALRLAEAVYRSADTGSVARLESGTASLG